MEDPKPLWVVFADAEDGVANGEVWVAPRPETVVQGEQRHGGPGVHVVWDERRRGGVREGAGGCDVS